MFYIHFLQQLLLFVVQLILPLYIKIYIVMLINDKKERKNIYKSIDVIHGKTNYIIKNNNKEL